MERGRGGAECVAAVATGEGGEHVACSWEITALLPQDLLCRKAPTISRFNIHNLVNDVFVREEGVLYNPSKDQLWTVKCQVV